MKKRLFVVMLVCSALLLGACERLYTDSELGMIVEWGRYGWSEVFNETGGTVTMITSYRPVPENDYGPNLKTFEIQPGHSVMLQIGAFLPGDSIQETLSTTIRLSDGTEFVCTREGTDLWSVRFYNENVQVRKGYETSVVRYSEEHAGKKIRHDIVIKTYHIDEALVDLWRSSQP